ncbi:MAG: DUF89 family protein, partial [Spirochaetaceae bacterium]
PASTSIISSGSVYPGTILEETTPDFQRLFQSADLIIAKGQGNYETLCEQMHPGLFFILRVKCQPVASSTGAQEGQILLLQATRQARATG